MTAIISLGWQSWNWLKTGAWSELPLSRFFDLPPASDYVGFNRIVVYVWDQHIGVIAIIVTGVLWWLAALDDQKSK